MRLATLVTLISLAAMATGCGVRVRYSARYAYGYGGYSTSRGTTNIVWNQPQRVVVVNAPAQQIQVASAEHEVNGSDGSYGWVKSCNADVEIHRLSEQMARRGCQFESYGYDETRAVCGGVRVLLRRDATNVYRLCPPGTDRGVCQNAWAPVVAP